jgi:hypothetical protein
MNPAVILMIIQAAGAIAGPAFKLAMNELQVVDADHTKHAPAMQTFVDAVTALSNTLVPNS